MTSSPTDPLNRPVRIFRSHRGRFSLARKLVLPFAMVTVFSAANGCALLGVIAHKASPPPKVPAMYTLEKEPTIVLVEKSSNPGEATQDAQQIAAQVTQILKEAGHDFMLDSGLAIEARSRRNADGSRQRPSEIARACGARQFVYIDLKQYGVQTAVAGESSDGSAEAALWVVDAQSAEVIWPPESNQGFPIGAVVPFSPVGGGASEGAVRENLNHELALKAARLFFTWTDE